MGCTIMGPVLPKPYETPMTRTRPVTALFTVLLLAACGDDVTSPDSADTTAGDVTDASGGSDVGEDATSTEDAGEDAGADTTADAGTDTTAGADADPDADTCVVSTDPDDWRCLQASGQPSLYTGSQVLAEDSCGNVVVMDECEWGTRCFEDEDYNDGFPECARSFSEEAADSLFYDYGCFALSELVMLKTNLEVDCRCRNTSEGGRGSGFADIPATLYDHTDPDAVPPERPGNSFARCQNLGSIDANDFSVPAGSGPPLWAYPMIDSDWYGGWLDPVSREFYGLVLWTNSLHSKSGSVVSFNLDTGARRVVSGLYNGPDDAPVVAYGSGYESPNSVTAGPDTQPLTAANALRPTPDGMLRTLGVGTTGEGQNRSAEIVEIDPATGERTLIWQSRTDDRFPYEDGAEVPTWDTGQCLSHQYGTSRVNEHVAINARAFAVGPEGNMYLSFYQTYDGAGIIELSPDGTSCRIVSRWGARDFRLGTEDTVPAPDDIGAPSNPDVARASIYGLMVHEGGVYGVTGPAGDMLRIDIATGDRTMVSEDTSASGFGGIGEANIFYDDTRDYIFAMGTHAPYVGAVIDPDTGFREPIFADPSVVQNDTPMMHSGYPVRRSVVSPATTTLGDANYIGYGPFAIDPEDNDIAWFVLDSGALVKFEFSTFNNYIFSY